MKKILLSMAAVSALAIGAPAAAQYSNGGYQNGGYQNGGYQNGVHANVNGNVAARIGQLQARIQAGVQSGAISRQEAVSLRQQLRQLRDVERHYSVNGVTGREQADLQLRIRNLRQQIRYAEGGQGGYRNDGYDGGYDGGYANGQRVDRDRDGYDDRDYDRDGRWEDDRMGRNRDGYGDRDYDRNGRWDDDYQDRYEDQSRRGGIGGVLDSVLGRGGLRVGQRVSGGLYAVPSEYRSRFRDGNGSYYRSDGRSIYQIDARTQTVVRIYPMSR
jgi:hypothetical protein